MYGGSLSIRNNQFVMEPGDAFWMDPTMKGKEFDFGGEKIMGDPSVVLLRSENGNMIRLAVWAPAGSDKNSQLIQSAKEGNLQAVKIAPDEGAQSSVAGKPSVDSQTSKILLVSGPIFNLRDSALRFRESAVKMLKIMEEQKLSLSEGTKVTVLAGNAKKKQVRILEGEHKNDMVWTFTPFLLAENVILDSSDDKVVVWEDAGWDMRKEGSTNDEKYMSFMMHKNIQIPRGTRAKLVGGDAQIAKVQICEGEYNGKTVGTFTILINIQIGTKATLRSSPEIAPFTNIIPVFKTEQDMDSALDMLSDIYLAHKNIKGSLSSIGIAISDILNTPLILQKTKVEIISDDGIIKMAKIIEGKHSGIEGWIPTEWTYTQTVQNQNVSSFNKEELLSPENAKPKRQSTNLLPAFSEELQGSNPVRVRNPNDFAVATGLRSGGRGKNFDVSANGVETVYVPDGKYDIYFVYSDKPDTLFQGDSFTLNNNGIEIQIVQVVDGNYNIRQVK